MKKNWFNWKGIFHKKDSSMEGGEKRGVLKVDFRYLYQRRQRMAMLAEGLGMSVDEMVEAVKNRVLEERREKAKKIWSRRKE